MVKIAFGTGGKFRFQRVLDAAEGFVLGACVTVLLLAVNSCNVYGQIYIYIYMYIYIFVPRSQPELLGLVV